MYFGEIQSTVKYDVDIVYNFFVALYTAVLTATPINSTQPSPQLSIEFYNTLTCKIQADFPLSTTIVESRWTLPNGIIIIGINDISSKYSVDQRPNHQGGYLLTRLFIRPTTYSDANTYTCEVRYVHNPYHRGPWIKGQATLQLLCKHVIWVIAIFLL